jgi:hypothetical protein
MNALPSTIVVFALALTPAAQTAPPAAAPHLLLETVGPEGWRIRLGPTNLGSLLASEQGQQLWQPQVLPLFGYWRQLFGDEADYAAARARLLEYQGRVQLAVWFEGGDLPLERQGVISMALVLDGDGRTDLARLAKDLADVQRQAMPGAWSARELGGQQLQVLTQGDDFMTAPFASGSSLVVCAGTDDRLATTFAAAGKLTGAPKPPPPNSPALRLSLDLATIVQMTAKSTDADEWAALRPLGFDSLGPLQFLIGSAGPQVMAELVQSFTSDERGMFAAFCPTAAAIPTLRRILPSTGSWRVGHFDLRALYEALLPLIADWSDATREELQAEMQRELGMDPATDLLAHMTTEVALRFESVTALETATDATWTLVWKLADERAFARGFETLLAQSKPLLSREATETVDGIALHRYGNMFGYDLWCAVGNGHCTIAGGRDAEAALRSTLQQCKELTAATIAANATADEFRDLQRYLPDGAHGLARAELDAFVALPFDWWWMLLGELTPLPAEAMGEDDEESRATRRELLRSHGLGTLRSATGNTGRQWRWRLFW